MREYWIKMLLHLALGSGLILVHSAISIKLYQLIWPWLGRKLGIDTQVAPKDHNVGGIIGWLLGVLSWGSWVSSPAWLFYVEWILVPAIAWALGLTLAHLYSAWEERKYE